MLAELGEHAYIPTFVRYIRMYLTSIYVHCEINFTLRVKNTFLKEKKPHHIYTQLLDPRDPTVPEWERTRKISDVMF